MKRQKELEEARKAGLAEPEVRPCRGHGHAARHPPGIAAVMLCTRVCIYYLITSIDSGSVSLYVVG